MTQQLRRMNDADLNFFFAATEERRSTMHPSESMGWAYDEDLWRSVFGTIDHIKAVAPKRYAKRAVKLEGLLKWFLRQAWRMDTEDIHHRRQINKRVRKAEALQVKRSIGGIP